jgi:hypothetical protein
MRLKYLLLSLCLVGFTQPAAGARIYWRNGLTTSAEQQVSCGPHVGCAAITWRAGCRQVRLGGVHRGTYAKLVCTRR